MVRVIESSCTYSYAHILSIQLEWAKPKNRLLLVVLVMPECEYNGVIPDSYNDSKIGEERREKMTVCL